MEMNVLEKISEQREQARGAELKALEWIYINYNDVLDKSITQLAKSCEVSEATLVRAFQTLGFTGYRDFRIALAMDISAIRSGVIKNTECIYTDDKSKTIIEKIFTSYQQTLQSTLEGCDEGIFDQVVEKLISARNILVFSGGTQTAIADYFVMRFISTGIICNAFNEAINQRRAASVVGLNDVVVVINHSGCIKSLIESTEIARERGATIIAITSFSESPLANLAHLLLPTFGKDLIYFSEQGNYSGMTAKVAQNAIIDSLAAIISMRYSDIVAPNIEYYHESSVNMFTGDWCTINRNKLKNKKRKDD